MTPPDENEPVLAWHFLSAERTAHGGFRVEIGVTYTHDGPLVPCRSGLHASRLAADAAYFHKGPFVTRVECRGPLVEHGSGHAGEKFVCGTRTALWGYDATDELRAHARWCALSVAHLWEMPEVVRRYLETGDESIRAAAAAAAYADAAASAADAADAARAASAADAARAAACSAADAARAAAAAADYAAALSAAALSAADAARAAQNADLESRLIAGAVARGLIPSTQEPK